VTAIIAFASTPISGPVGPSVGVIAFGGAAIATGLSVTTLVAIGILAGVIGVVVFWAIYNDYEIIEVDASTGKITLRLKKNK
jgi:4-hydroxybenzoate polyprenyltransferase